MLSFRMDCCSPAIMLLPFQVPRGDPKLSPIHCPAIYRRNAGTGELWVVRPCGRQTCFRESVLYDVF